MAITSDIHFISLNRYKTVKMKSIKSGDFLRANYEEHPYFLQNGINEKLKVEEAKGSYVKNIQKSIINEEALFKNEDFILDFLKELLKCKQPNLIEKTLDYFGWNNSQSLKDIRNIVKKEKIPQDFTISVEENDKVFLLDFKGILDYFHGIIDLGKIPMHLVSKEGYNIFTELNKIDPFDDKSIIKFAKYFGLPSGHDKTPNILEYSILFSVISKKLLLINFIKYKNIFDKFISYKLNISNFKSNDETLIGELKNDLENQLKNNIFKMVQDNEFGFKIILFFNDFFHLAYYQIADACSNQNTIKKCEFCNNYFLVTHKSQKFCPALPRQKRSSCEIAFYNQRKKYKKE